MVFSSAIRFALLLSFLTVCSRFQLVAQIPLVKRASNSAVWSFVGPGGGGAMFNPTVDPHNDKNVFVSCDMTGAYQTHDGGQHWRMFNLRESIRFFAFDPVTPSVCYASALGLFKSVDSGRTWALIYPQPESVQGIIAQGDHGSEIMVTADSIRKSVVAMAIDPVSPQKLYIAVKTDQNTLLCYSENGGKQWEIVRSFDEEVKTIFIGLTDRTIYLGTNKGVWAYQAKQWQFNAAPAGVKTITAYAFGQGKNVKPVVIYAIAGKSYFNSQGETSGIFISTDGAKSWANQQRGIVDFSAREADIPEWRGVGTCIEQPETVYVSFARLKTHPDSLFHGVAKSSDYGKTWKLVWKDLSGKTEKEAKNVEGGWLSERFGTSWAENPFQFGVAPQNPDVCYATDFGRTIKTSDGGNHWTAVYTKQIGTRGWQTTGLEVTTAYSLQVDPFDPTHWFILYTDIGLMESHDKGTSWSSATKNGVPASWVNTTYSLAFDSSVKNRIWAAMSGTHDLPRPKMFRRNNPANFKGGIVYSEDGGKHWQVVSQSIGEAAITWLIMDPKSSIDQRTLYACAFGKGVFKSTDGGKNWVLKNKGLPADGPFAWKIVQSPGDGTLFLIIARRSDDGSIGTSGDGALFQSTDGAETWQPVLLPTNVNAPVDLAIDPRQPSRLLLSAWGRKSGKSFGTDIGGGLFLSTDNGKAWKPVFEKDQHVHDVTIDPRTDTYYACGFTSSAYRSDDRGLSWKRIKGYNFKWGQRVEPDPFDPQKVFMITFGGGVWHGPANGDPQATEDIITPVAAYK